MSALASEISFTNYLKEHQLIKDAVECQTSYKEIVKSSLSSAKVGSSVARKIDFGSGGSILIPSSDDIRFKSPDSPENDLPSVKESDYSSGCDLLKFLSSL